MIIVELSICDYCILHCNYCVARTKKVEQSCPSLNNGETEHRGALLPMEQTLNWLAGTFNPKDCVVLVSGGEPTITPFGYEWSNRLITLGYQTYILTNGWKMPWEASKWNKKARYLLTHHIEQMPWEKFELALKAMITAGHKNITLQSVIHPSMIDKNWELHLLKERFAQFGFPYYLTGANKCCYKGDLYHNHDERYWNFEDVPYKSLKNIKIFSVRPQGTVHICHTNEVIGSIYEPLTSGGVDYKCWDKESGNTNCQTENTVLAMSWEWQTKDDKDFQNPPLNLAQFHERNLCPKCEVAENGNS